MARPPLVPPGPELSAEERTRYARHLLLPDLGALGQRRLRAARVLVVGAGGLGSPVLLYLAAAGVGTIGVADDDVVETVNLQRQVVHGVADVGRPKTESAADAVRAISPSTEVVAHSARLDTTTALTVVADYDLVVDGADNFPTRYVVGDACARLGVPHVWGSVYRFDGQVSVWWSGEGPCYACVFLSEPAPDAVPSCAVGGVLGAVCASIGSVMATEAVKLVTGTGEPLVGRLLVHDALRQTWDTLPVRLTRPAGCALLCRPHPRAGVGDGGAASHRRCGDDGGGHALPSRHRRVGAARAAGAGCSTAGRPCSWMSASPVSGRS